MSNNRYKDRANCVDVLSAYNEWGIDLNEMKTLDDYKSFKSPEAQNNQDKFFINYLNAKLKL